MISICSIDGVGVEVLVGVGVGVGVCVGVQVGEGVGEGAGLPMLIFVATMLSRLHVPVPHIATESPSVMAERSGVKVVLALYAT